MTKSILKILQQNSGWAGAKILYLTGIGKLRSLQTMHWQKRPLCSEVKFVWHVITGSKLSNAPHIYTKSNDWHCMCTVYSVIIITLQALMHAEAANMQQLANALNYIV